jgi:MYXO-CTERM domain-containing protein
LTRARAAAVLLASAALLAAGRAGAFERTVSTQCGSCLYWAPLHPTQGSPYALEYLLASPAGATGCGEDAALAAVEASFAAWADATHAGEGAPCTSLRISFGGTTADPAVGLDGRNVVAIRAGRCEGRVPVSDPCWSADPGACSDAYGCWEGSDPGVLATTLVTHHPVSGMIYDADIELFAWGGTPGPLPGSGAPADGWYFTCEPPPGGASAPAICGAYGQGSCVYVDLQNTLTHEAGHFFGLAHPLDGTDDAVTMWAYAQLGELKKRSLEADDVDGICAIYPLGAEPTRCAPFDVPECAPVPGGCSCGTGGGTGALGLAALFLALAPRPRRHRAPR